MLCQHQLATAMAREAAALLAQTDTCIPAPTALPQAAGAVPWASQQAPATCYVAYQAGPLRLGYTFRDATDDAILARLRTQLSKLRALLAASAEPAPAQILEPATPPTQAELVPAHTPEAVQALVQQAVPQALTAQAPRAAPATVPINGPTAHGNVANGQGGASSVPPPSVPGQPEGWCARHQVPMRQRHNSQGSWWSHKRSDGSYCKGQASA